MSGKAEKVYDLCVVGGGAAGFFTAITAAEHASKLSVLILEQNASVLGKVRVSGGGRCNVTHACFEPKELVQFYPRGSKELLGPFHKFMTGDTMDWFEKRGVPLKIEDDNRVFPVSNSSQSIIQCLMQQAARFGIEIQCHAKVMQVRRHDGLWKIDVAGQPEITCKNLMLAPGSSPMMWKLLEDLGHTIIDPVPSLFTFNIQHALIKELPGISVPNAILQVDGQKLSSSGPLLITHWGLSGPAVLKLSAWGARLFHAMQYRFKIQVNWTGLSYDAARDVVRSLGMEHPRKTLQNMPFPGIPQRLWKSMLIYTKLREDLTWGQLCLDEERVLLRILVHCALSVNGKSTFKEEFVTCGGVALEEIDFRTMESKKFPGLYLAGEILDIDAVTGGFNFQAAWTCGWLAGKAIGGRS